MKEGGREGGREGGCKKRIAGRNETGRESEDRTDRGRLGCVRKG